MIALRRSTVLADARLARASTSEMSESRRNLVRVGAERAAKDWDYTDSNGKKWAFMDHEDSVPAGQRFEASTEAYPDSTYKFYEATEEALTTTVDNLAKSLAPGAGEAKSTFSVGEGGDDLDAFSSTVETDEGPIATETETARLMADEGITHDAAVDRQVKKKAATATSKAPPTASGAAALKAVQAALIKLGYDLGSYGADGKIGPYTRGAITKFKKDHGLTPNSTIDAAFRTALDAAAGGGAAPGPAAAAAAGGIGTVGLIVGLIATVVVAVGLYVVLK